VLPSAVGQAARMAWAKSRSDTSGGCAVMVEITQSPAIPWFPWRFHTCRPV